MRLKKINKKTIVLFFMPLLVALMVVGVIFSIKFNKESKESNVTFTETIDYSYNKVYLFKKAVVT